MWHRNATRRIALTAALVAGGGSLAVAQDTTRQATPQPVPQAAAMAAITRYTLVEVAGSSLPAQTEKEWRCREEVTAGTLSLRADGRWLLETASRETCGDRTEEDRDTDDGTYRAEGSTLHFLDDDGRQSDAGWGLDRDIDLDDLRTGTLAGDGTLTVRLADDKQTLVFRRQAS
jgi:hypothetical protein